MLWFFDISQIEVPVLTLIPFGMTIIYSFIVCIFGKDKHLVTHGAISYLLLGISTVTLVALTGWLYSPFIGMLFAITLFCDLFGHLMLLAFFVATNSVIVYLAITEPSNDVIAQAVSANIVLLASFIIWHKKKSDTSKEGESSISQLPSNAKADIIINSIADGVIVIDPKGIINLINPAAENLLGWSAHDTIGLDYKSVIKLTDSNGTAIPDDLSPIRQVALSNKPSASNDLVLITKSGKRDMVSTLVSPIGDSSQNAGVIVVFRDITREKEQERQKAEFISTASHEMRTPVASIEGYLGLALNPQTASIDDKARLYLQKAQESTKHLGRLFQDLLTVSKAEDARIIPKQQIINITNFTGEVCEMFQPKAKEKGIYLSFAPAEGEGSARRISPYFFANVDPDNLREVLSNLLDNAIKYTAKGGVTVDITGDKDNVTITVEDTGLGIPPEDQPHLFQKFYRVDNSDTREIGGTGLGLYISRRLVEGNGGSIFVSSIYGKGSKFSVQFPRANANHGGE